jgi:hypothetical protein
MISTRRRRYSSSIILRLRGEGMLFLLFAEKKELHRKSGQFCDDNDIVTKNALRVNTGIRNIRASVTGIDD